MLQIPVHLRLTKFQGCTGVQAFVLKHLRKPLSFMARQRDSIQIRAANLPVMFTGVLTAYNIQISMDGKGRWVDNVFVERLWRSVKYEEVYLNAYDDIRTARASLDRYFRFYNTERRHQSLDRQTPDQVYYETAVLKAA